ncbi:uncharacterized protein LOC111131446 [Crassostrea virginica]
MAGRKYGQYIFIKGRDAQGNSRNACAVVKSHVDVTSDMQISFWYHMNGIGIGSLTLAMSKGNGSETKLWEKEGRQGPSWMQATVDLPTGTYVISFKATVRLFYGSDLAIDDVEMAPVITTTNPPPTTLPPSSELPFYCDFDSSAGLCGLKLMPSLNNTVGWNMTSKNFIHHGWTYIEGDASSGKGKYLLLSNWNHGENGDAAQIVSPFFRNDGAACLSLKLYLARNSSGTLSVYQKLLPTMELELLHEEVYKDDVISGHWSSLLVTLKDSTFLQVILEGSYTGYLGSVIGVDDMKIEHGPCVARPTTIVTSPALASVSSTVSSTTLPTLFSTSVSSKASTPRTMTSKQTPSMPPTNGASGSTSRQSSMSSHSSLLLSSTPAPPTRHPSPSTSISTILSTSISSLSTLSLTQSPNSSSSKITSSTSSNSSFLTHVPSVPSLSLAIKHTPTKIATEAGIQTTTLNSEFTSLLNASNSSELSLSSTSSSENILLSTIIAVLQSTSSYKPVMKSSTSTSPTPEVTSSTKASNSSGRETRAIVLGVCLPIIALVIISVIVLICKKNNKISMQSQKKTRPKEEKHQNVTTEMSAK